MTCNEYKIKYKGKTVCAQNKVRMLPHRLAGKLVKIVDFVEIMRPDQPFIYAYVRELHGPKQLDFFGLDPDTLPHGESWYCYLKDLILNNEIVFHFRC